MKNLSYIVIPAKDEAPRLGSVLQSLQSHGYQNIVVVNDGSTDRTQQVARSYGATVLKHFVNLGPGAATQTGIEFALAQGAKYILTIDADGQHLAEDIAPLLQEIVNSKADVVIGSRFLQSNALIPRSRLFFNKVANFVTAFFTGIYVSDSQSGMKVFTADFAKKLDFKFNGFEFCTELFRIIYREKAILSEVPIQVIYTKETMEKGQSFGNGIFMVLRLVRRYW
ncbi:MAG: glycosyltransferase family 2 protein [Saprospiraceae bacterium]|nr:glycosyltransferase family 2 protein [Saprospiraceae bacterium]